LLMPASPLWPLAGIVGLSDPFPELPRGAPA
jgi:hypothetical protein